MRCRIVLDRWHAPDRTRGTGQTVLVQVRTVRFSVRISVARLLLIAKKHFAQLCLIFFDEHSRRNLSRAYTITPLRDPPAQLLDSQPPELCLPVKMEAPHLRALV